MKRNAAIFFNSLATFFSKYGLSCISLVLLACSAFFFVNAYSFRARLNVNNVDKFQDQQSVRIAKVVDGDELVIEDAFGQATRLRLLGIKSFDPTASDPLISEYGKICFSYLKATATGKQAVLHLSGKKIDERGRLLGSLTLPELKDREHSDLGEILISKGYTMVYTRYDFPQMGAYLRLQEQARQASAGFWSDPQIAARARSLMKLWAEENNRDD